jgi:hypothetical protein
MIEVLQFYQTNIAPVVRFFPILAILPDALNLAGGFDVLEVLSQEP